MQNITLSLHNVTFLAIKPVTFKVTHKLFYYLHLSTNVLYFFQTGWHLDQVDVECSGVKYNFPCDRWLAEDEDDKQIVRELVCTNIPQNGKLVCTNIPQNGKLVCTNIPQNGKLVCTNIPQNSKLVCTSIPQNSNF